MTPLWINESHVALDDNGEPDYRLGESGVYETSFETPGELYRQLIKSGEYGRCTGRVYVDAKDGPPKAIGWVFLARKRYEDSTETYLHETWVTLHDAPDTVTREHHYHALTS